ncbi:ABC-type transport system ATP-binding protein (probable substrate phosphate/phosphonate) [Natrialba magadii ATCC 43099]|uniref:ABC-type transport system ATP-binding protein (Probable substrate phosphate/phosphonate) n=1 Tax=Natrialba magadii (strain ATCC 43099 / DSM 3394 / CCM 3739 / CIP 104546 / IAM 13178 / JCM 8861 / NBRC 102185 / NCIMB 2190 / MS3) TaxID=547559 RepID=D3SXI0_NATMM|nr:phosphonate ABC transporter ATP-binding protein [Natrialba magadii]ADD05929.1 ABC-type transport system ATP-binding protein (probable substrate phosphate/phosphonate) [Natrialba magadii ATCC 43099]ELY30564.1 phosphonate ABC transporter ATPase [Natrialba magadii ATCC 43099]
MLEVTNLRKVYLTGDEALTGVSTAIEGNEIVAMIGPSGAGKSTFIRCINQLTEPTDGEVTLDGTELTALDSREMKAARRNIGMVFQEYNLVERLTVMENVLSGRLGYVSNWAALHRKFPQEDVELAYDILETVGLGGMENKRADELSGGQRQRVGIARAVVQEPTILLADEPTSSLDPETSHAVMELLTEIAAEQDIPVLINIHEVHLAVEYADRILGLHDGTLVFDGPTTDLDENAKDVIYRGEAIAGESSSNFVDESDTVTDDAEHTERSAITGD